MSREELEALLHEHEGSALDFKRDQYPFVSATDREKSELLKDILALANAWRRSDAFILIGVDDVVGGRGKPVGVTTHLEDSQLQQFVNSKTNRPLTFSYEGAEIDGVQIAVIRIPIQDRPIYLVRDFDRLRKQVVYVRRGSSTDVASPDEIARMGIASPSGAGPRPRPVVSFADLDTRKSLGTHLSVGSICIRPIPRATLVDAPSGAYPGHVVNRDYIRDLFDWFRRTRLLNPVGFSIFNDSSVSAVNAHLEFELSVATELHVVDRTAYPERPHWDIVMNITSKALSDPDPDVTARRHGGKWIITATFGTVKPKATAWTTDAIWLGASQDVATLLRGRLFADNLPEPEDVALEVSIRSEERELLDEDLEPYVKEELGDYYERGIFP